MKQLSIGILIGLTLGITAALLLFQPADKPETQHQPTAQSA